MPGGRQKTDVGAADILRRRMEAERKPLLNTIQVAAWLGIAARTLCLWAEVGEIPAFKMGRQWRFREADIRAWLRDHGGGEHKMDE